MVGGYKYATSRENRILLYAMNKDADQPAHPRSLCYKLSVKYNIKSGHFQNVNYSA